MRAPLEKKAIAAIAVMVALGAACSVGAENAAKSTEEIRNTIIGRRIYLAAPLGGEFPLFYAKNGRVDGSGEALGLGKWLKPKDQGRWSIEGNWLCQQWETWYDGRKTCFIIRPAGGNRIEWEQDNGDKGMARIGD